MSGSIRGTMGPREWFLVIALALVWGGAFFLGEVALVELPPFTIVFARVALAALALLLIVFLSGQTLPREAGVWGSFLVMGAINNVVPFSLIVWGQTEITGGLASVLNATTPVFTVLLAHVLTRDERLTAGKLTGVILGLVGVAVMIGPEALKGLGAGVFAQLAVIGAAISYACAGIFGRRFAGRAPLVTATGQLTCSSLLLLPLALLVDRPWLLPLPGFETWGALIGLALLGTALAYLIYFQVLATAGATNVLLVTLLVPVSAILLGGLILGERLEAHHFPGMALIAVGLLAIDGRVLALLRRPAAGRAN